MIQSTFFIRSAQGNVYLINIQKKGVFLVHPYIPVIYFQNRMDKDKIHSKDYAYYKKKIAYYKKWGIISETPIQGNEQLYLSSELIEDSISNIKQVVFETTEKCNLKCKYCYYGEYYNTASYRNNQDMSVEYAWQILEFLSKKQSSQFNKSWNDLLYISFYGGEPLLNATFIEDIIKNQKIKNRRIIYSMTSNGTLLNKNMPLLINNDIRLTVSLDGNKENNTYRVFHNKTSAFDKVLSNLQLLRQQYPAYFKKNVNFNAVLHNKNSIQEIYNFFQNTFEKQPSIAEINNSGIADNMLKDYYATYRNRNESFMQTENYEQMESEMFLNAPSSHSALIFLHQYLSFVYKSYENLLAGENYKLWISTGTCIPFSRKMFVTADGKILPCEKIAQKHALGRVDENGIHLDISAIADKYNAYYRVLSEQCAVCYRQQACNQCIFFLEELDAKPQCHGFMNKKSMQEYLADIVSFFEVHSQYYRRMMKDVVIS